MFLFIAMIFIWVFLTGELSWGNVGFASILSLLLVFASGREVQADIFKPRKGFKFFKYLATLIRFALFFLGQLLIAGTTVFVSILKPVGLKPGVIAVPLDVKSDSEITLLANLITLTPGTLTIDVSTDKRVMYVHTIDFENVESFREEIKNGFEKRVIEVMNP